MFQHLSPPTSASREASANGERQLAPAMAGMPVMAGRQEVACVALRSARHGVDGAEAGTVQAKPSAIVLMDI
jgi:hypothetical protein